MKIQSESRKSVHTSSLIAVRLVCGMVFLVGAAILAINASDDPPPLKDIPCVDIAVSRAELYSRGTSSGARFYSDDTRYVLAVSDALAASLVSRVRPGDRLAIWSTKSAFRSRTIWQIDRGPERLVEYSLTSALKRARNRRTGYLAWGMACLGAVGTVGGWLAARALGLRVALAGEAGVVPPQSAPAPIAPGVPRVRYLLEETVGVAHGVEYTAALFDDETVSIEIDHPEMDLDHPFEFDARAGAPPPGDDAHRKPVAALLELGANYVEAGVNAAVVGIRVPAHRFGYIRVPGWGRRELRKIVFDPTMIDEAVAALIRLRDGSS